MKHINRISALLLALALLCTLCACQSEQTEASERTFTVRIVAQSQGIETEQQITSDLTTLGDIIEANAADLGATYSDSSYGMFITAMGGYTADESCEYFAVVVNGEDSMVGVSEIKPAEGDVITFELRTF